MGHRFMLRGRASPQIDLRAVRPYGGSQCSPTAQRGGTGLQKYLFIAMGGALGSIARYWVGSTIASRMGAKFPYGTFVINLTACVLIGFSLTYLSKRTEINPAWRFLVPIGFVGAYSTFSTYEWETLSTLRSGAFAEAALYAFGSLFLGLFATWIGIVIAEFV
jgi:CrcB protein